MKDAIFWVQIHDLPLMARNEYIGREVSMALGSVEELDLDYGEVEWGEFMHIRVTIDITKPLLWCKKLNLGGHEPVWVSFSYERQPNFCYCCGILGHTQKDCKVESKAKE